MNFLDNEYREPARNNPLFGLCDNQDGEKAFSNIDTPEKWIARVKNDRELDVVFTPVDKCIIKDHEYEGRGRCDGLLTTTEHLYFVELKNQAKAWIPDAIKQLESTIDFFKENHNIDDFKHKKAFACNKQRSRFQEIDNEQNLSFFRKHKVRLDIQAEILVI